MKTTVLATAYAVNPYKGSEDGTGWNLVCQIARFNKAIVITRENNRDGIEKYLTLNPDHVANENIRFLYFDLPYWARFWKKGERGAMLYFYLWQMAMPFFIKKQSLHFDIVHNLNFHNDWTPTFLWTLGKPLVWGPIGHHPKTPKQYVLQPYGTIEYIKSRVLWMVKNIFWKCDPFLRISLKKAAKIIVINSGPAKIHCLPHAQYVTMPAVASVVPTQSSNHPSSEDFTILSVGRLVALKGFDITIGSFSLFYSKLTIEQRKKVKLKIVGKGPLLERFKSDISAMGLRHAIEICEWVEKEKMDDIYKNASVFLFPSHEGAGMVVPEAMSHSLPVLCFDNEGPGEFVDKSCGMKVPYCKYEDAVNQFADALMELFENKGKYASLSEGAYRKFSNDFTWDKKGNVLEKIYQQLTPKADEKNSMHSSIK